MTYLLDTSFCIDYLNGRSPALLERYEQALAADEVAICAVVLAELCLGAEKSARPGANYERIARFAAPLVCYPFDDEAAYAYAKLRALLEAQGNSIGPNDLLIAAIALQRGMAVVSANQREFLRVPGLVVESW